MNFFLKGDFKINDSWQQKPPSRASRSRQKSRDNNSSLVNVGKKIMGQPSPDLLDDHLTNKILRELAAEGPPSTQIDKKKPGKEENTPSLPPKQKGSNKNISANVGNSGGEKDLLSTMAARLKTVQMTCKNQREQIKEKSQTIQKLRGQNIFLKGMREDASKEYQKMRKIEQENAALKSKVQQMEEYLKKYGLRWVGTKVEGKLEQERLKKDIAKGNYQYRMPRQIDINTIVRRVEQLNAGLHSQGKATEVYSENGIHKFRKAQPLPLGFFANGIAIKGFKFFPYKSKESLQILGDLLDGYFPYVLKHKYPNGVFLRVVDKVAQKYSEEGSQDAISTFQSKQQNEFKPPSKQEFLNKLPKQVVKNGKIINIRGQIQKRLNGESSIPEEKAEKQQENEWFQRVQGALVFKTQLYAQLQNKEVDQSAVCTIKIRDQQGQVYILHLLASQRIDKVYQWMGKAIQGRFKVMGNFPRRQYTVEEQADLQELGFCPNGMLHIQSTPK